MPYFVTPPPRTRYLPIVLYLTLMALALTAWDTALLRVAERPDLHWLHALKDALIVLPSVLLLAFWAHRQWRREGQLLQAQLERERRFALLTDAASDWIWEMDADLRFRYLSPRFYHLTGVTPARILGHARWELAGPEDDPQLWRRHRETLESRQPFRNFVYLAHIPGDPPTQRYFKISGNPVFDRSGRFIGYVGVGTDITEQKLAERALQESQRMLATLLGNLPGMAYRCQPPSGYAMEFVSDGCLALTGYSAEQLLRNREPGFADLIHPQDINRVHETIAAALQARQPYRLTYRIRCADEQEKWVWEQGCGVYGEQGELLFLEGLITDISEQKAAEEQARRTRIYLKNVIDSMPSILLGVDTAGYLVDWNRHAAKTSGLSWRQARGLHFTEVFPQLRGYRQQVEQAIREQRTVKPQRLSVEVDGRTQHLDVMVYPLVAENTLGAVIRVDDVSARVKIEEMMVQAEKMLSVGGLAAGMAHEINNPLGTILQAAQNIQRRLAPDQDKNRQVAAALGLDMELMQRYLENRGIPRFLDSIREAGARAAHIVSDMLTFSRRTELRFSHADPRQLLETALRLAANDYQLSQHYDFRRIRIERDYDPELASLYCDPTEIEQVLLNLIKNAAQAMLAANVPLPILTLRTRRELGYASIEVIDNGPGMEESVRRRVFEPFFTTKEVGVGTGLGLSVSYFIVTEQHKGSLTVSSKPGQGARFTLLLPLEEEV
ncbi:MAG TPA: PAS domain S-box protein [Candidatus Competibacteraceae bacterium]|nr:PAS domain S-box protein [Candidatus Competibacteraceae bacterium]